jgi:hypothetical protein
MLNSPGPATQDPGFSYCVTKKISPNHFKVTQIKIAASRHDVGMRNDTNLFLEKNSDGPANTGFLRSASLRSK